MTNLTTKENTFEYWVDQAAKGRNKAECWQACQRIAEAAARDALERVEEGARVYTIGWKELPQNHMKSMQSPDREERLVPITHITKLKEEMLSSNQNQP